MNKKMIVGVDLGGTTIKLALLTIDGQFIEKWEVVTDTSNNGEKIPHCIASAITEKINSMNESKESIVGIGIGAPGPVRLEDGLIFEAVNLGWKNYPLKEILEKETGIPVVVDNDANVAALGEMWKGAGNGAKDLVMITLGTGVGGGVIVNGLVAHGKGGAGGEIGHITVKPEDGYLCNCGKEGCLETIASATGIARIARDKVKNSKIETKLKNFYENNKLTAKEVFECYSNGDPVALEVVDEVTKYLALGISAVANTLNPEKIVIGGGVSKAGSVLLNPLREKFNQYAFTPVRNSTDISIAELGNDAGALGAAYLVKKFVLKDVN
jgi:glucokinase